MNNALRAFAAIVLILAPLIGLQAGERCTVREAQQALVDSGLNPGPIDGAMGRRTRAAIRAFQSANELPVTGNLNPATCLRLTAPAEPAAAPDSADSTKTEPAAPSPDSAAPSVAAQQPDTADPATSAPVTEDSQAPEARETGTEAAARTDGQTDEANTASAAEPSPANAAQGGGEGAASATAQAQADDTQPAVPSGPVVAAIAPPYAKFADDPPALYRTAFGLLKSRSFQVAVDAFEEYLTRYPQHDRVADAMFWLGMGYIELGQEANARASLEQLLARFPNHRRAAQAQSQLHGIPVER